MIFFKKGLCFFSDFKKFSPFKIIELNYESKILSDLAIVESPLLKKHLYDSNFALKNITGTQLKEKFRAITIFPQKIEASQDSWGRFLQEIQTSLENKTHNTEIPNIISNYKDFTLFFSLFQSIRADVLLFLQNMNNSKIDHDFLLEEFEHVFWINRNLNILDLPIWQQISLFLLKNGQFCYKYEKFLYFFDRLLEYINLFMLQPNKIQTIFYFNESLLLHLYKKELVMKLFSEMQSNFERLFISKEFKNIDNFAMCLDVLMKIIIKFKRAGSIDYHSFRTFLESLQTNLNSNDLYQLKIKTLLVFYRLFGVFGLKDSNLFAKFNNIFVENIKNLALEDEEFVLDCILTNWKNVDNYDERLYFEYISTKLIHIISNLKPLSGTSRLKAAKLVNDLVLINIDDNNILIPLIRFINENDYKKLPILSKKALHTTFQILLYIEDNKKIDLTPFKEMINGLASMCIELNCNKKFIKNKSSLKQKDFIDCCHYQQIMQNKLKNKKNLEFFEQNSSISFQEKAIFKAMQKYINSHLLEPCEFYKNYQECLYKIDIALHFTKYNENVAIELVGNPYSFTSGEMLTKKQIKFNLLEKFGWKIVVINISEQKYLNFFASLNDRKSILFIDEIFCMIEEKLQRKIEKNSPNKTVFIAPQKKQ